MTQSKSGPFSSMDETILYYDRAPEAAAQEARTEQDRTGLEAFAREIPVGGAVFDAGCGAGQDLEFFRLRGFQADGIDASARLVEMARAKGLDATQKNILFAQLKKEHYDGIWCSRLLPHLSIEECQRVLAIFFQALKPRTGVLFLSFIEGEGSFTDPEQGDGARRTFYRFSQKAMGSLLRQSGFAPILHGVSEIAEPAPARLQNWNALVCRRV